MGAVPPPLVGARNATPTIAHGFATLIVQLGDPPFPGSVDTPASNDPRELVLVSWVPELTVIVAAVSSETLTELIMRSFTVAAAGVTDAAVDKVPPSFAILADVTV
jgi:hypothetical protein